MWCISLLGSNALMFSYHLARCVALNSALECEQKMLCNELNRSFSPALLPTVFRVLFDCTSKWLGELSQKNFVYVFVYFYFFSYMYRVYTITIYVIRKYTIRVYTTTALVRMLLLWASWMASSFSGGNWEFEWRFRAVATIGAWGGQGPPTNRFGPPHQTFGKLKYDDISMMI